MANLRKIIEQAQKEIYCPACGRTYQLSEIKIRAIYNQTVILQTICTNDHSPLLFYYISTFEEELKIPTKTRRITFDDVLDFYQLIQDFDGDFERIWVKDRIQEQ